MKRWKLTYNKQKGTGQNGNSVVILPCNPSQFFGKTKLIFLQHDPSYALDTDTDGEISLYTLHSVFDKCNVLETCDHPAEFGCD